LGSIAGMTVTSVEGSELAAHVGRAVVEELTAVGVPVGAEVIGWKVVDVDVPPPGHISAEFKLVTY